MSAPAQVSCCTSTPSAWGASGRSAKRSSTTASSARHAPAGTTCTWLSTTTPASPTARSSQARAPRTRVPSWHVRRPGSPTPRHPHRARPHRQRPRLPLPRLARSVHPAQHRASAHPALHASHQRQSRSLHRHRPARVGVSIRLSLKHPAHPSPPWLGALVQPATSPQLPGRPAADQPCRAGPWSVHLELPGVEEAEHLTGSLPHLREVAEPLEPADLLPHAAVAGEL